MLYMFYRPLFFLRKQAYFKNHLWPQVLSISKLSCFYAIYFVFKSENKHQHVVLTSRGAEAILRIGLFLQTCKYMTVKPFIAMVTGVVSGWNVCDLFQDFTGVPAVVDFAAMRDAVKTLGGDPRKINPLCPVDLVIDHSVQVTTIFRVPQSYS